MVLVAKKWSDQKFRQVWCLVFCADRSRGERKSHADIPFEAKLAALLAKIVADGPRADADTR